MATLYKSTNGGRKQLSLCRTFRPGFTYTSLKVGTVPKKLKTPVHVSQSLYVVVNIIVWFLMQSTFSLCFSVVLSIKLLHVYLPPWLGLRFWRGAGPKYWPST